MAYLEIKNVNKNFGKTEVLKGIDISVEKGEVLSIIGSSGSGKTTLLRCINFLETPDEGVMILDGETLFDGSSPTKDNEKTLRKKGLTSGWFFSLSIFSRSTTLLTTLRLPLPFCLKSALNSINPS